MALNKKVTNSPAIIKPRNDSIVRIDFTPFVDATSCVVPLKGNIVLILSHKVSK